MRRVLPSIYLFCGLALSCDPHIPTGADVYVDFDIIENPTIPLADTSKMVMTGVYNVVEGSDLLGDHVVGRWVGRRWCIYARHEVVFAELAGGFAQLPGGVADDSIKLRGYLRNVRAGSGTRIRLRVRSSSGAAQILRGIQADTLTIEGETEEGDRVVLRRLRAITAPPYTILAHRGGARNSDRLGISENSIEMIVHASVLGATGIEIDVKRTRDNQMIVFHDDTFSPRTVRGTYLLGRVENFDLEHIRAFGRLLHGEKIPTLQEALEAVIDRTDLSVVWLDVKDAPSVPLVAQVQRNAKIYAQGRNKYVRILMGMPSDEVLNAYRDLAVKDSTEVLVELDADKALGTPYCTVWAPVWTRNITDADISRMHVSGLQVFSWTVDLPETMVDHLKRIDGILSNYPTLVTGIHYSK